MIEYYKNFSLESLFYVNENGLVCQEEWRDIPNYVGRYQVSDLGRVKCLEKKIFNKKNNSFSTYKTKIKKSSFDGGNYLQTNLYKNNTILCFKVQKLMAMAFLGHVPCGYVEIVDHKNNIRRDNRLENLQLITNRENVSKDTTGVSKYTGVCWDKNRNLWRAHITIDKKYIYLIITDNEDLAGRLYQIAVENLHLFNGVVKDFRNLCKDILSSE